MKILFATNDYDNYISGVHSWLKRFVNEIAAKNIDCCFLIMTGGDGPFPFIEFLKKNKFNYKAIPITYFPYTPERTAWVIEETKKYHPDVFLPGFTVAALYAIPWIKKMGILTVNFIHSDDHLCRAIIHRFVTNKDVKWNGDLNFSVSKFIYDFIEKEKPTSHYYLPYGIITSSKTSTYSTPFKIIYFGRIEEEQKKILDTTKGLIASLKVIDDAIVDIYGTGSAVADLKKLLNVEGKGLPIHYKGMIDSESANTILAEYHAFVLLSDYEGLPLSLLESMSCGVVPICMNIRSGVNEVIFEGKTGFLLNNRHDDLLKSLSSLKNDENLWNSMSKNSAQLVNENFDIKQQVLQWLKLIKEYQKNIKIYTIPDKVVLPKAHKDLQYGIQDVRKPSLWNYLHKLSSKIKSKL